MVEAHRETLVCQRGHLGGRVIFTVVDDDEFPAQSDGCEMIGDSLGERPHGRALISRRYNHRKVGNLRRCSASYPIGFNHGHSLPETTLGRQGQVCAELP